MGTLDISTWKQKGKDLMEAINKEVKSLSSRYLYTPVPDSIRMSQAQYDDLMKIANMPNMFHSEDRLYKTPYNVMEVRVSGRKRLTFTEAHSLDDKSFNEWEKSVEDEA